MYQLNKDEHKTLENIKETPYMLETVKLVEKFVLAQPDKKVAYLNAFDEIFHILNNAKSSVEQYLTDRKKKGRNKR